LWLASIGTTVPTVNVSATALRFFFKITLKRRDLAEEVVFTREPRRLPVVLSPEEVGRLLASARNIKHKALLSLACATGLRASEVVPLKLTDIDSDRMLIRVEQGKGKKDRYVILSPNLLEILREWWRVAARRDGCLPVSTGCFLATGGSAGIDPPHPKRPNAPTGLTGPRGDRPLFPSLADFMWRLPRPRGDRPWTPTATADAFDGFPARAGVFDGRPGGNLQLAKT
jgi:integrase